MRKSTHILLACLVLLAVSCSQNKFEELDRLLEQKDEIASAVKRKTDALRLSYISTPPRTFPGNGKGPRCCMRNGAT